MCWQQARQVPARCHLAQVAQELELGADFYIAVDGAAIRTADIVLDATLDPIELVDQALEVVLEQLGSST